MEYKKIMGIVGTILVGISAGLTIGKTFESLWAFVVGAILIVGLIFISISENRNR